MKEKVETYPHELVVHLQPNGAIMLDKKSMYYFRMSSVGIQLAMLLSKTQSIEETAKIWGLVSGHPFTVDDFNTYLDSHPFTSAWKTGLLDNPLPLTGSSQYYIPISCTLQLTNACNLSCSFCYASSGKPHKNELSTNEWIHVMQILSSNGVADLTITGGEAKLVRNFKKIIATASSLFTNVSLFSNGLNWKADEIELIKSLGNVNVQVSIDGIQEKHDRLRGRKGAFKESFEGIRRLSERGVPTLVAMTVNPYNYEDVYAVIEKAVQNYVTAFRAGVTLSVGRAENQEFGLSIDERNSVRQQMTKAINKWGNDILIYDWNNEDNGCTDFCTPGYLSWYIQSDGIVTPCQIEDAALGHILKDRMDEIGSPQVLIDIKNKAQKCNCISRVELIETDLPFFENKWEEVHS